MIIFDQLRISDDGKKLYLNARVNEAEVFSDTYIEKVYVCLAKNAYEAKTIDPESSLPIYSKTYGNVKQIDEVIEAADLKLYVKDSFKDLLFVYIKCKGVPEEGKCFTSVGNYVMAAVFDESVLYQKAMGYTKELAEGCTVPVGFADFILQWNAFNAAIETEHYITAVEFYNTLFEEGALYKNNKTCGCHG